MNVIKVLRGVTLTQHAQTQMAHTDVNATLAISEMEDTVLVRQLLVNFEPCLKMKNFYINELFMINVCC